MTHIDAKLGFVFAVGARPFICSLADRKQSLTSTHQATDKRRHYPTCESALKLVNPENQCRSLDTQATLAADDAHFEGLMRQLLDRFRGPDGAKLLQRRGSLIVCRLAALLGGRRVFRALAAVLADADDLRFVSALVQALNLILLTAPEVRQHDRDAHVVACVMLLTVQVMVACIRTLSR